MKRLLEHLRFFLGQQRFFLQGQSGYMFKIDGFTGDTWYCYCPKGEFYTPKNIEWYKVKHRIKRP